MIFFLLLLSLVLVAQIAELLIPALPWLHNAHVYIVPVIVFYGAMALPFPLMLALAFFAGVLLDALTVQVIGGKVEISAGSSILLYGVLAGDKRWPATTFCPRSLGSALYPERRFHLANSSGAIPHDYVSPRFACVY